MRVFIVFLMLLTLVPAVSARAEKEERKVLYWYDPMVPGPKFDKPGKSPYMDMDLVPFYADEAEAQREGGDAGGGPSFSIDPAYRQALGVKTGVASVHSFGREIRAPGVIAPSTRLEHAVSVRTAGWIVDLKTGAPGDTVKKGDLLFTFYSPDLMQAQSDFLVGGARVGNAEQRLRLHGMDDQAIGQLKAKGRYLEQTPFYAPADGVVTVLNVRKGAYIEEGGQVLSLQDFSQLWVMARVPVRDLQFLSSGTPAVVTVDETGDALDSLVDYIYPEADAESRYGMVRLVLDNPDGRLKTDTLVSVAFESGGRERLAVPEESVLYGKDGGHVIEALENGSFRPVSVKTGITARGMTEILSGLKEGQEIVTSAQFMIDAESNLRGGTDSMDGASGGGDHEH